MNKFAKLVASGLVFGLVTAATLKGVDMAGDYFGGTEMSESGTVAESGKDTQAKLTATSVVNQTGNNGSGDVSTVAEQVLPSIVAIDVTQNVTGYSPFYGQQTQESQGSGSGIILAEKDNKLYIATNNHVVEGADSVKITFNDKTTADAEIKGTDSSTDLAVVMVDMSKLSADALKNIKVATIGDSEQTKVGEQAIAVGNALGYGTSVTVGYISAKDKTIDLEDEEAVKLLQTDAAINPGNSGGALVNSRGELIGINSSKFASEEIEGMGFAIPISTAEPILTELMNQERVSEEQKAYLGIRGQDVTKEYMEAYGIPEGVCVTEVTDGSPAEKAGLKQGYIITGVNGKKVSTMAQLQERLSQCRAGDRGTLTVKVGSGSEYEEKTLEVTFGKAEQSQ